MRSHVIVLAEPLIDYDLCLPGCCEPLGVEHLATQRAVEALVISVLPRRSRIDLHGWYAHPRQPILERRGRELGPIVGP